MSSDVIGMPKEFVKLSHRQIAQYSDDLAKELAKHDEAKPERQSGPRADTSDSCIRVGNGDFAADEIEYLQLSPSDRVKYQNIVTKVLAARETDSITNKLKTATDKLKTAIKSAARAVDKTWSHPAVFGMQLAGAALIALIFENPIAAIPAISGIGGWIRHCFP